MEIKQQILPAKYSFFYDLKTSEGRTLERARHALFLGATDTGKSYLQYWFAEKKVHEGKSKVLYINCNDYLMLREALGFSFPNEYDDRDTETTAKWLRAEQIENDGPNDTTKYCPRSFKVKVYVPISKGIPDKLPANFIPFTIPIKGIHQRAYAVAYGNKEYKPTYSNFRTVQDEMAEDESVPTFRKLLATKRTQHEFVKGFGGARMIDYGEMASLEVKKSVLSRFDSIVNEGLLSAQDNPNSLEELLKKELLDQETIVILYTGYLAETRTQSFVMTQFAETCYDLLAKKGYDTRIKYESAVLVWEEVRQIFQNRRAKSTDELAIVLTDNATQMLATWRHARIELWFITQSPTYLDPETTANIKRTFITRFEQKRDVEELVATLQKQSARDLTAIFAQWRYLANRKGIHRFGMLPLGFKEWQGKDRLEHGFELPRPRMAYHGKRDLGNGFRIYAEIHDLDTGKQIGFTEAPKEAKHRLKTEYETDSEQHIAEFKRQKEDAKAREDAEQAKAHQLRLAVLEGIRAGHTKTQICRETSLGDKAVTGIIDDWVKEGDLSPQELLIWREKNIKRGKTGPETPEKPVEKDQKETQNTPKQA